MRDFGGMGGGLPGGLIHPPGRTGYRRNPAEPSGTFPAATRNPPAARQTAAAWWRPAAPRSGRRCRPRGSGCTSPGPTSRARVAPRGSSRRGSRTRRAARPPAPGRHRRGHRLLRSRLAIGTRIHHRLDRFRQHLRDLLERGILLAERPDHVPARDPALQTGRLRVERRAFRVVHVPGDVDDARVLVDLGRDRRPGARAAGGRPGRGEAARGDGRRQGEGWRARFDGSEASSSKPLRMTLAPWRASASARCMPPLMIQQPLLAPQAARIAGQRPIRADRVDGHLFAERVDMI